MPKEGTALYFIAIIPPSPIFEQASGLKNHFKQQYQSKAALNSPPHITLHMPFEWKVKKEEELVSKLSLFSKSKDTFELELKNFGCFAPRVIFINVIENNLSSETSSSSFFTFHSNGMCKVMCGGELSEALLR